MKQNKTIDTTGSARKVESVDPYHTGNAKGEQVEKMFDSIAPAYDFMNTAMTFGLHRSWRDKALRSLRLDDGMKILDVATGTGDVAFRMHEMARGADITGIDLSDGMLEIARRKLERMPEAASRMRFMQADCLKLPFDDDTFDVVTVAYGVRNFQQLEKGYGEMLRVLRPGGRICVIELAVPSNPVVRLGYNVYSRALIPMVGRMVSGDSSAYTYLPQSIAACPQREAMTALMKKAGFCLAGYRTLTLGVVAIYTATKPC